MNYYSDEDVCKRLQMFADRLSGVESYRMFFVMSHFSP